MLPSHTLLDVLDRLPESCLSWGRDPTAALGSPGQPKSSARELSQEAVWVQKETVSSAAFPLIPWILSPRRSWECHEGH